LLQFDTKYALTKAINTVIENPTEIWAVINRGDEGEIVELTVAKIATGKILWKRALKPRQIVPLPM